MKLDMADHDRELLAVAGGKLAATPASNDRVVLLKWQLITICQYLVWASNESLTRKCRDAITTFIESGETVTTETSVELAMQEISKLEPEAACLLPAISLEKHQQVIDLLECIRASDNVVDRAMQALPDIRGRLASSSEAAALPGMRHRFELAAAALDGDAYAPDRKSWAAAAILYVDNSQDVIPDNLRVVGMLDDDYALRVALDELGVRSDSDQLHWTERIAGLWADLPFLQGVELRKGGAPLRQTWLDRANSYAAYSFAMARADSMLILLQPSVACTPIHSVVSLMGLVVLDVVTSSSRSDHSLIVSQFYEVDGCIVEFDGIATSPVAGWLKLKLRDGVSHMPPQFADRMTTSRASKLSSLRDFTLRAREKPRDPIQQFFDWEAPIPTASVTSAIVIVSSQRNVLKMFDGVSSNGIKMLNGSLMKFLGESSDLKDAQGSLVIVVPTMGSVRKLLDSGLSVQIVLVDGFERLIRCRDDIPFVIQRKKAPGIICWSPSGYYPLQEQPWLPPHRVLEISSAELREILDLEPSTEDTGTISLWEAATGDPSRPVLTDLAPHEREVLTGLDAYLNCVRATGEALGPWRYFVAGQAKLIRALILNLPARWDAIRAHTERWLASLNDVENFVGKTGKGSQSELIRAATAIAAAVNRIGDEINSRGEALLRLLGSLVDADRTYVVCQSAEHTRIAARFLNETKGSHVEALAIQDFKPTRRGIVIGWCGMRFARQISAHTPSKLYLIGDDSDCNRWRDSLQSRSLGMSMLRPAELRCISASGHHSPSHGVIPGSRPSWHIGAQSTVECVLIHFSDDSRVKVLDANARVYIDSGEVVGEKPAAKLHPGDRVLVGDSSARWSPTDEFTDAVVNAMRKSAPRLVSLAIEWRVALKRLVESRRLTEYELREHLKNVGVVRETATLVGWLALDRPSPIAPRNPRQDLSALWGLLQHFSEEPLEVVIKACVRLRALRNEAAPILVRALQGERVGLQIVESELTSLVASLRRTMCLHEVERVALGRVPREALGWWIPTPLAFELQRVGQGSR